MIMTLSVHPQSIRRGPVLSALLLSSLILSTLGWEPVRAGEADPDAWVTLTDGSDFAPFRDNGHAFYRALDVMLDPKNPRRLKGIADPDGPILVNGPGRTKNLYTREQFGDVEVACEFFISENSNAGVKLLGIYEVQIYDSYRASIPLAKHSGGIYPRSVNKPFYRHIDEGYPPLVNAAKPPGTWQTLEIVFRTARFDEEGRKVANAVFESVVLNGQIVHRDQEVPQPTGSAWKFRREPTTGTLMLQADHGPVAFRNVRVRRLGPDAS